MFAEARGRFAEARGSKQAVGGSSRKKRGRFRGSFVNVFITGAIDGNTRAAKVFENRHLLPSLCSLYSGARVGVLVFF